MRNGVLKRLFREKHASLSLSINAIVVLIMAITMLGLGLAFMKNMFGGATSQFMQATDEIKNQLYDKLKSSDKKITLNTNEVNLQKGKSATVYVGVKNFGEDADSFSVGITCLGSTESSGTCGLTGTGGTMTGNGITIKYMVNTKKLEKDEVAVVPISITATSSAADASYSIQVSSTAKTTTSLTADDTLYLNIAS